MREKLMGLLVFFLLIFCCDKLIAVGPVTVSESDILRKGEIPHEKKKETFDGFSDIFDSGDFKTSVDKRKDFFALYAGREIFNCTFTWKNFFDKLKKMLPKKDDGIIKLQKHDEKEFKTFEHIDSCFYRYFRRFFKSPGRLFLDGLTFLIFSQRAFFGMDMFAEYSFFWKKKLFFTLRLGWDYNDFSFKYNEDFNDVFFEEASSGAYDFKDMSEQKAVELCGGNTDSFKSEKKKVDLKYCNELASVQEKNKKLQSKKNEIFTGEDVFVFISLYKWFFDFGLSYYNNPRNPAESTFIFRFLIKLNALYYVTDIDYVIASKTGVINHFSVDNVVNKYVSSPFFGCKVCLCFGYKNWEIEISLALFNKYNDVEKCSGQFYSESLQKRLPVSIAFRNRFFGI